MTTILEPIARIGRARFGEDGPIDALAFSPDGRTLVVACAAGTHVWDFAARRRTRRLAAEHADSLFWLDSETLAVVTGRATRIYSAFTWRLLVELPHPVAAFAAPEGDVVRAVVLGGGRVELRDVFLRRPLLREETSRLVRVLRAGEGLHETAISRDGRIVAIADGRVRIIDAATGEELGTLNVAAKRLAFVANGRTLTVAESEAVTTWALPSLTRITTRRLGGHVLALGEVAFAPTALDATAAAFTPDGQRVVVGMRSGEFRVLHATTGLEIDPARHAPIETAEFSPDGERLVLGDAAGRLRFFEAEELVELETVHAHSAAVRSISFSPDGELLASAARDRAVRLARRGSNVTGRLNTERYPVEALAFSADGRMLALAGPAATWDTRTLEHRHIRRWLHEHVVSVAWSPDSVRLACAFRDGSVRLWNRMRRTVTTMKLEGTATSVTFVGSRLAVAFADREAGIYSTRGERLFSLPGAGRRVVVSPCGERVAVFGEGVTIAAVDDGRAVATLATEGGDVEAVALSAEGRAVVVVAGAALVFDVPREHP